jgi:adenylate cyclase
MSCVAGLTNAELAKLAGSTREQVRKLIDLGILTERTETEGYSSSDIQRVRLAKALDEAGIPLEAIGQAIRAGNLSFDFVDTLWPAPAPVTPKSLREVAVELGLKSEDLIRMYAMWGLPRPNEDDSVREDDAALFADIGAVVPADALNGPTLARAARILGESLRRVADASQWFFKVFFEQPALKAGMTRQQIMTMVGELSSHMTPSLHRWVLWLLDRHIEHNQIQYIIENVEMAVEASGAAPSRPTKPAAIAFLDLTGYTALTEELGDEAAAEHATRLAEVVQEVSLSHGGRPVKLLGDGVMFYFSDPGEAVVCAFELMEATSNAGLPRAHIGVNAGPVVESDGDYFGRTVNVAARIADYARPREILVSAEVVAAADGDGLIFHEIGPVTLKDVPGPVSLYSATLPQA